MNDLAALARTIIDSNRLELGARQLLRDRLRVRGIEVFSRRSVEQNLPAWTQADVQPPARHRLYRAVASEHYVLTEKDRRVPVSFD